MRKKKRGSIMYPVEGDNPLLDKLDISFWKKMIAYQNQAIGKTHEQIALLTLIKLYVPDNNLSIEDFQMEKRFRCFNDKGKIRRIDIYVEKLNEAFEVKAGRVCHRKFIREQIRKDSWLIQYDKVSKVTWFLFEGATQKVKTELTKNRVIYIDMNGDEDNFTNIEEIFESKRFSAR